MKTIRNHRTALRMLVALTAVALLAGVAFRSAAATSLATVNVVNNSSLEIRALYLSPADNDNWGGDQLNGAMIAPGASYTLSYSWDQPTVKIVAEDKDGCFLINTVDATANSDWTITDSWPRNCGG
jgi:hypothetical protein